MKEILRECIYRFKKVANEVGKTNNDLKCYIFKKQLRSDFMFHEKLRLEEVCSLNYILDMVQPCIDIDARSSQTYVYIDDRRCEIHVHDTLGNGWRIIIEDP